MKTSLLTFLKTTLLGAALGLALSVTQAHAGVITFEPLDEFGVALADEIGRAHV